MKKRVLFSLLFLGLFVQVKAQITVSNAVFPNVGDTLFFAVDNQPSGIVMTAPGGDQKWDFSHLQPALTFQLAFEDPATGVNQQTYPAANLVYKTGVANGEAYLQNNGSEVLILGFSGGDQNVLGLELASIYNPPIVQSRAPINFFDIHQISTGLLLPFAPNILPDVDQLPVRPDSIRIRAAINRLDVVDGWGTLTIPGGTFDVLREKRTEYRELRLDVKVPPLGWLDITDLALQFLQLNELGVDTTVSFYFYNDQSKEPIAICTTDNSQLRVVSVQYKNLGISTGLKNKEQLITDFSVFPNPAQNILQLRASGLKSANYTITLYSILGQEVFHKTGRTDSGRLFDQVDISSLDSGVYLGKISSGNHQTGQVTFVKN